MPAEDCLKLPGALSLDEGTLLEPLSVGLDAVRGSDVDPAARGTVPGAGPIGLNVVACAKAVPPPAPSMSPIYWTTAWKHHGNAG